MEAAMLRRFPILLLAVASAVLAQKYDGPRPPQKDLPYLKHASNLIATEAVTGKEEGRRDEGVIAIAGASSSAVTPLASPIFLMQAEKIAPEQIELYRLDSKNGRRELPLGRKKSGRAVRLEVARLTPDGLWKIEAGESLEPGEYALSPRDSNQAFCFQVR